MTAGARMRRTSSTGSCQSTRSRSPQCRRSPCAGTSANRAMFTFMDPALGSATPVPATNNAIESQNTRIRGILRTHRAPLDPMHQGRVLVVPPAHRAPRKRRMASPPRMARRADRAALPTGMGAQRRRTTGTTRPPRQIRHRHRLERIPHRHTMEKHRPARHTFWPITLRFLGVVAV